MKYKKYLSPSLAASIILFIFTMTMALSMLFLTTSLYATDNRVNTDETTNPWHLSTSTTQENYYVIDLQKNSVLYDKNARQTIKASITSNILLALLAYERLDENVPITVSNENANVSQAENIFQVNLQAGSRYSLDFLVYSLFFYDSNAVFHVLSEALTQDNRSLVNLFNERARSIGMDATLFRTSGSKGVAGETTLVDASRLIIHALSSDKLSSVFRSKGEIVLSDNSSSGGYLLENRLRDIWTLSFDTINGASFAMESNSYTAFYLATIPNGNYNVLILQSSQKASDLRTPNLITQIIREAYRLVSEIGEQFELADLVTRGGHVRTIVQKDGVEVNLIYLDRVQYLRPRSLTEFRPQMQLSVSTDLPLPIQQNQVLGQMTFTMPDGTRYVANVGSAEDIYSENNVLSWVMEQLRAYPEIIKLIQILFVLFISILLMKLLINLVRFLIIRSHNQDQRWGKF